MSNIETLLHNEWIRECQGPWGSMIVLAQKPHQETITQIEDFVWRMCVSYRKLNSITEPFQYPIPRCDDSVTIVGIQVGGKMYFISLDAKQGYHQIRVVACDQEKLAFFAPNGKKYTFTVMPFGPTNSPSFYTFMMNDFQSDWNKLFFETARGMNTIKGEVIEVLANDTILISDKRVVIGSKIIIDDILLYSTHQQLLLLYLDCICKTFQKFRCSFQLKKCEFLKERVEYVGHDLTSEGNCPAQSKFDLIRDWHLPTEGQSLHSFIGLLNFYHKYLPYMEIRLKPLRALERQYRRSSIPQLAWTQDLMSLFSEMKLAITSSPMLARYDPAKPTFIKTDWCALGMAWIIMQPDNSDESASATKIMLNEGICNFDLTLDGARLQPIAFGSRSCTSTESHFHSFVGEVCSGRWGFAKNRRYLWGNKFWWMCDCKAVKEVLNYNGTIHMISRWAQELLGYDFEVVHRSAHMMKDVDSLTRKYGEQYATHFMIAAIMREQDRLSRPSAYLDSQFVSRPTRITCTQPSITEQKLPFTANNTKQLYNKTLSATVQHSFTKLCNEHMTLTTDPVNILLSSANATPVTHETSATYSTASCLTIQIVAVDDFSGSCLHWTQEVAPPPFSWAVTNITTHADINNIFPYSQFVYEPANVVSFADFTQGNTNKLHPLLASPFHLLDFTFTPGVHGNIFDWLKNITFIISAASRIHDSLLFSSAWIPASYLSQSLIQGCNDAISYHLPSNWTFSLNYYSTIESVDPILAERACIVFTHDTECCKPFLTPITFDTSPNEESYFPPFDIQSVSLPQLAHDSNIPQLRLSTDQINRIPIPPIDNRPRYIMSLHHHTTVDIYDPAFRIPEYEVYSQYSPLEHYILVQSDIQNTWTSRALSLREILSLYSIPLSFISKLTTDKQSTISSLFQSSTPFNLRNSFMSHVTAIGGIQDKLLFSDDVHHNSIQCYFVKPIPTPHDWFSAYQSDPVTNSILAVLGINKASQAIKSPPPSPAKDVKHINSCFQTFLLSGGISYASGRITVYKTIPLMNRTVALIVVPQSMQRLIFTHYHASPSGGHAGEYKTLYRLRLRFLWPRMREDIKSWVKQCGECVASNTWRNKKSELYFSWPVTLPFWIMHVDLWSPGNTEIDGRKGHLLNAVCDLTQFAVSSVTYDITALQLSQIFMSDVVLTFGMCAVVVVDAGSSFRGIFEEMCTLLGITFWILARGNHKGNGAERYHRYLNKVQTIEGSNVGTNTNFMRIAKTTQYAWNSAPIDGTDIVRSMAAVGRDFRFPLDVKLSELPQPNDPANNALYNYLRDVSNDSTFATSVLKILIEERRLMHQTRLNQNKVKSNLKVGDIVKAHVQVQSKTSTGVVDKLSYRARGPFRILEDLGFDSFSVQDYHNPKGATRKYKSTELYLLPPALFPSEPLDTMDHRYLHYEHAPTVSPLAKPLQIEAYNQEWFESKPSLPLPLAPVHNPETTSHLDYISNQYHIPPVAELVSDGQPDSLFNSTADDTYPSPEPEPTSITYFSNNFQLASAIESSIDRLFFIEFVPAHTLRPKWFLVQVDLELSKTNDIDFTNSGLYVCSFLAKHPTDIKKSDERSRWWPDWYEYHRDKTGNIVYGDRVLFRPNITPNRDKYILWAAPISLATPVHYLLGPFDFRTASNSFRTRNTIDPQTWHQLHSICLEKHLQPPMLGVQNSPKPNLSKPLKRKRQISPVRPNA